MHRAAVIAMSILLSGNALAEDAPGLFDEPAKTEKVDLAPDPGLPESKPTVSCHYFQNFAVKEIDEGEVGAAQLSIVPLSGGQPYKCQKANIAGEKVIGDNDWSGYFQGVKGRYVFFGASDGVNGGVGFAVFDASDGKKLFDDNSSDLHAIKITPSGISLQYSRVYAAECSLFADAAGCWTKVKQATGLTGSTPPDCSALYKAEAKRMEGRPYKVADLPSVVEYEADTLLEAGQARVSATGKGAVSCRLAD